MTAKTKAQREAAGLRRRAEEKDCENCRRAPEILEAVSVEAAALSLHELRVHQIELEMQNEELRRTQAVLEASRARYFDFYNLAPVGYLTISEKGIIMDANLTITALLEVAKTSLVRRPISLFIFSEDQDCYYFFIKKLFATAVSAACELRLVKPGGAHFWVRIEATLAQDSAGKTVIRAVVSEITERVRLQQELRERDANFNCFFNTVEDFLFVLDRELRILHINQTVLQRLEYAEEELLGQSVLLLHPEQRREEAGQIVANMLSGVVDVCLIPLASSSGKLIFVETRITAGEWNGRPALFGVSNDISVLRISEEKLAKTFQATSALIAISTLQDGIYLDVNDAFLTTLGYERQEVIGKSSRELQVFPHEDTRDNLLKQITQEGFARDLEVQVRTKAGETIFGLFSAEIVDLAEGRLLITTMIDISKLKQAEESCRINGERLKLVLQASGAGIWDWNLSNNAMFYDKKLKATLGYAEDEVANEYHEWQSRLHPADNRRVQKTIDDAQKHKAKNYQVEFRLRHKDGTYRWVRSNGKITYDGNNHPIRMTGSIIDISELKKLTDLQLESKNRLKDFARAVPDISFVIDEDGWLVEVFGADEELLPATRKKMLGKTVFEVYPDKMAAKLMDDLKRSIDRRTMYRVEYVVEVAKGNRFFVGRVSPMNYLRNGKKLAAVVLQDFTERWKVESLLYASYQMRRKSDFLNDLVQGNNIIDAAAMDFAQKIGLNFSHPLFCCIVSCEPTAADVPARKDHIMTGLGDEADRIVWDCREGIGVLYLVRESNEEDKQRSIELAKLLQLRINSDDPLLEVLIGIGEVSQGTDGLRKCFQQARSALNTARSSAGGKGAISHYRDMGIMQLLSQDGNSETSRDFVSATIGKIIDYDLEKGAEYLLTLEVILTSDSPKEAAQTLFLHPNTVLFRRHRIEKLLGVSLDNFETKIALGAALKLHKLNK